MIGSRAILLIGPTGSGKTPLGDWLQAFGLCGSRCHHFDFGAELRSVASQQVAEGFAPAEVEYIQAVVEQGALLENETFYLALRILEEFVRRRRLLPADFLVMNGLPRHSGQAEALVPHLEFSAVVHLICSAEIVWERLRRNSGGDRIHRTDDERALVERKLAIFGERTRPLLEFYRHRGVALIPVAVQPDTQPAEVSKALERAFSTSTRRRANRCRRSIPWRLRERRERIRRLR